MAEMYRMVFPLGKNEGLDIEYPPISEPDRQGFTAEDFRMLSSGADIVRLADGRAFERVGGISVEKFSEKGKNDFIGREIKYKLAKK